MEPSQGIVDQPLWSECDRSLMLQYYEDYEEGYSHKMFFFYLKTQEF